MATTDLRVEQHRASDRPEWLTNEEWPFEQRFVEVDGQRIHYVDEGVGPVLLFVHTGLWSFVWRGLITELQGEFRCIALDFPGHGLSEAADGYEVALGSHAGLLGRFVEKLALTEVTLVAYDLGGTVAFAFAARHPEMVRALVGINTFAWPPDGFALNAMLGIIGSRPMQLIGGVTNFLPRMTSSRRGIGGRLSDAGKKAFLGPFRGSEPRRNFHRLMRSARHSRALMEEVEEALSSTLSARPTLLVYGEKNDPFGFRERFKTMLSDTSDYVVEGRNHFPMCDDPSGVANALREWWDEVVGRQD